MSYPYSSRAYLAIALALLTLTTLAGCDRTRSGTQVATPTPDAEVLPLTPTLVQLSPEAAAIQRSFFAQRDAMKSSSADDITTQLISWLQSQYFVSEATAGSDGSTIHVVYADGMEDFFLLGNTFAPEDPK